jgi:ammonia channel protein AmtB
MIYQCMFACIAPCIAFGSGAERTTMQSFILFFGLQLCMGMVLAPNGWLNEFGVLDFSGGISCWIFNICLCFSSCYNNLVFWYYLQHVFRLWSLKDRSNKI